MPLCKDHESAPPKGFQWISLQVLLWILLVAEVYVVIHDALVHQDVTLLIFWSIGVIALFFLWLIDFIKENDMETTGKTETGAQTLDNMSGSVRTTFLQSFTKPPSLSWTIVIIEGQIGQDLGVAFVLYGLAKLIPTTSYLWAPLTFVSWFKIAEAFDRKSYTPTHHFCFVGAILTSPVSGPYNSYTYLIMFIVISAIMSTEEVFLANRNIREDDGFPPVQGQVRPIKCTTLAEIMVACGYGARVLLLLASVSRGAFTGWQLGVFTDASTRHEIPGGCVAAFLIVVPFLTAILQAHWPHLPRFMNQKYVNAGCAGVFICSLQGLLQMFTVFDPRFGSVTVWMTSHPEVVVPATGLAIVGYMSLTFLKNP